MPGIYHIISGIVFNDARDRSVKVLSELRGMPGYERMSYWWDFVILPWIRPDGRPLRGLHI